MKQNPSAPEASHNAREVEASGLKVLPRGRTLIRKICMSWDVYLRRQAPGEGLFFQTV